MTHAHRDFVTSRQGCHILLVFAKLITLEYHSYVVLYDVLVGPLIYNLLNYVMCIGKCSFSRFKIAIVSGTCLSGYQQFLSILSLFNISILKYLSKIIITVTTKSTNNRLFSYRFKYKQVAYYSNLFFSSTVKFYATTLIPIEIRRYTI